MYKMLQYTFSKGERKRRKERARSWMDQKKRRTIRMLFFFGDSLNYGVHSRTCQKWPTLTLCLLDHLSSIPFFRYRCCFLQYAK